MPEINLRQAGFTYSAYGLFTKILKTKKIQKFKEKEIQNILIKPN